MSAVDPSSIPSPGPLPTVRLGDVADTRLRNGVRVVAVRRSQIPLVQLRLRVPLGDVGVRDGSSLRLLPKLLLAGTGDRSGSEVAAEIQRLGAHVDAAAGTDHLALDASAPVAHLDEVLALVADIVAHPSFDKVEVAGERERVVQEIQQEAADPVGGATRALWAELFPDHPYAAPLPNIGAVEATGRGKLGRFHAARVRPRRSTLTVVGDLAPDRAIDAVGRAFAGWRPAKGVEAAPALGAPREPRHASGILVIHRAGAVQSNLRVGVRCEGRRDPAFPALVLAMTVLGGTFSSRLVTNLRERHGYTYAPGADIDERRLATAVTVRADVATEVTAPALNELRYELARIATTPVSDEELAAARRNVAGSLAMASATQAELAGALAGLVSHDLDPSYLEEFLAALERVDATAVAEAAARTLGPAAMTTVVVGDADVVVDALRPLDRVTVLER